MNQAACLIALASGVVGISNPSWVHLLPSGEFSGVDGRGPWFVRNASSVIANSFARSRGKPLPCDYDHGIDLAGSKGGKAIAAGWIKQLQARSDGIWALIEWTPAAANHLAAKEYRFISPVFGHSKDGQINSILRAGLTNNPNLTQLTAICAARGGGGIMTLQELITALAAALGLATDATPDAVIAAVNDLVTARQSSVIDPTRFVPIADFQQAVSEVNRLNKGISLAAATSHVSDQVAVGKLPPFLRDWGIQLCTANKEAFDTFVNKTAGTVGALFRPQVPGHSPADRTSRSASPEVEAVCAALGHTPAEYDKANRE